jgi:hypothetical protein
VSDDSVRLPSMEMGLIVVAVLFAVALLWLVLGW